MADRSAIFACFALETSEYVIFHPTATIRKAQLTAFYLWRIFGRALNLHNGIRIGKTFSLRFEKSATDILNRIICWLIYSRRRQSLRIFVVYRDRPQGDRRTSAVSPRTAPISKVHNRLLKNCAKPNRGQRKFFLDRIASVEIQNWRFLLNVSFLKNQEWFEPKEKISCIRFIKLKTIHNTL